MAKVYVVVSGYYGDDEILEVAFLDRAPADAEAARRERDDVQGAYYAVREVPLR